MPKFVIPAEAGIEGMRLDTGFRRCGGGAMWGKMLLRWLNQEAVWQMFRLS